MLSSSEAAERRRARETRGATHNYIMAVVEHLAHPARALKTIIDPSRQGNVGRFLNHSARA